MSRYKKIVEGCVILALVFSVAGTAQDYQPVGAVDLQVSSGGYPRMAFDSTGTRLAVALKKQADAAKVVVLSVPDMTVIKEALLDTEPMAVAWSPLGDQFALSNASTGRPNELRFVVLSTTDWRPLHSAGGLNQSVASLVYDPVGDLLLVGGSAPGEVFRYEVGSWLRENVPPLSGVSEVCRSMAVSVDGRFAAMGVASSKLYVWPLNDTSQARALGSQEFKGEVTAVAFHPDSQALAAGDSRGEIMVFYRTEDQLWAWKNLFRLPSGGVTGIGFLADGSLVTTSTFGEIARWNIDAPSAPVETIRLGTGNTESLAFDPRGRWMAVGGSKIHLFPLGGAEMEPVDDFSSAPVTVVETAPPLRMAETVPDFSTVAPFPPPSDRPETAAPNEDLGNFLIWMAPGKEAGSGDSWVQSWAGTIDKGRYNPFQVIIPFETLNAEVMKANLDYLDEVFTPRDFAVLYTSAVLSPGRGPEEIDLAVGAYRNERIPLGDWLNGMETVGRIGPLVWMLDLQIDPTQSTEEAVALFTRVVNRIALSTEGLPEGSTPYKRPNIGVGLVTLSVAGCYAEMRGNIENALSGMADANADGVILDREFLMYLGDSCRTAVRADTIGDAKHEVPVLPPFRLGGR